MLNPVRSLWAFVKDNPTFMRRLNGWLTVIWFLGAFPICIFLSNSISFLVFISVYAIVAGHLSTWQASRVEVRQEEEEEAS
jgi:ABC-type lipoprotein release transport system permease subunit